MAMAFDTQDEISDEALLVLFANGDPQAAQALTMAHMPRVFSHAYRVLGDRAEAEDIAQEAMMRLWTIAPQWRAGEAKVSTWLYRVVANLCMDRLRKTRAVGLDAAAQAVDPAATAVQSMTDQDRAAALDAALLELPERQRQAVILRHIEQLANPEIAQIMGISAEAVESLTARGKRNLAAILQGRRAELGYDDD